MSTYQQLITNTVPWPGVLDPALLPKSAVTSGHRLATAAKKGDWDTAIKMLDVEQGLVPHQWRPGGSAWFTVLHQAAWHGAPLPVVDTLIKRGAPRSLRDAKGRRAFDVAAEHDQPYDLRKLLKPRRSPLTPDRAAALDCHLAEVIDGRIRGLFGNRAPHQVLRYPPVEILYELPNRSIWFPVPGMHGGFHIELRFGYLEVFDWNLVPGGQRFAHVITHSGAVLVHQADA